MNQSPKTVYRLEERTPLHLRFSKDSVASSDVMYMPETHSILKMYVRVTFGSQYLQIGCIILFRDMRSPMDFGQPTEIKTHKFAPVPHRIDVILSESEVTSRFDDIHKELQGRNTSVLHM